MSAKWQNLVGTMDYLNADLKLGRIRAMVPNVGIQDFAFEYSSLVGFGQSIEVNQKVHFDGERYSGNTFVATNIRKFEDHPTYHVDVEMLARNAGALS